MFLRRKANGIKMTGRERMNNIIDSKPTDKTPWSVLYNKTSLSGLPEEYLKMDAMDVYRSLGGDIMQFGNIGLWEDGKGVKYPAKKKSPTEEITSFDKENNQRITEIISPWGTLTATFSMGHHPVKYPVQTIEDVRILKKIWTDTNYVLDEQGCDESYKMIDDWIGDDGIYVPTVSASAVQYLLELAIGTINFYYLLNDHKQEMEELIDTIHTKRCQEYRIMAEHMPFKACITLENTSTYYISPKVYEKYSLKHISEYTDIMHANGKKSIIHMCGHVNNLLEIMKDADFDGIHALTPLPVGDTNLEHALDVLGEDLVIYGGNNAILHKASVTKQEIEVSLEDILHQD